MAEQGGRKVYSTSYQNISEGPMPSSGQLEGTRNPGKEQGSPLGEDMYVQNASNPWTEEEFIRPSADNRQSRRPNR